MVLELAPSQDEIYYGQNDLRHNSYPGRIAIMGTALDGEHAQIAYALMGRSEQSRDRVLVDEGDGSVRAMAPGKTAEEMEVTPGSELIYYRATRGANGVYVVSNGAQTDHVFERISAGASLGEAVIAAPVVDDIDLSMYEPDKPNYTPRITGVIDLRPGTATTFGLAIVRKRVETGEPQYAVYETEDGLLPDPGVGYGLQTYHENGNPLPSYKKPPFKFPLCETAEETAERIWENLNPENRVALVVHSIDGNEQQVDETHIINAIEE